MRVLPGHGVTKLPGQAVQRDGLPSYPGRVSVALLFRSQQRNHGGPIWACYHPVTEPPSEATPSHSDVLATPAVSQQAGVWCRSDM